MLVGVLTGCVGVADELPEGAEPGAPPVESAPPPPGQGQPPQPLALEVTLPATVSGQVAISPRVTGGVAPIRVELWADGAKASEAAAEPYALTWDSAVAHQNPLPAPSHPMDFGYYFADGKYGDFVGEVNPYTNLYYALAKNSVVSDQPWEEPFGAALQRAAAQGRRIHLNMTDPLYYDAALDRAAPVWSAVTRIEAADEPGWTKAETEAVVASIRSKVAARGLAQVPIGVVYTQYQVLNENGLFAANLDWVGIEAYVDPPGSADAQANVSKLKAYLAQAKARVPAAKKLVIVMMAYDRNGAWKDLATLDALQPVAYLDAFDDPRVLALTMFSYGRPGGTHDHPELKLHHRRIGERILGVPVGALSNGPHALEVRAVDSAGEVKSVKLNVVVSSP